jgi:hypothetical protein
MSDHGFTTDAEKLQDFTQNRAAADKHSLLTRKFSTANGSLAFAVFFVSVFADLRVSSPLLIDSSSNAASNAPLFLLAFFSFLLFFAPPSPFDLATMQCIASCKFMTMMCDASERAKLNR